MSNIEHYEYVFLGGGKGGKTLAMELAQAGNGFVTEHGLVLHNLARDPNLSVARAVGARAFPTTLFYDHNGKLLAMHLGPFSRATFEQALETLYPKTVRGALH